MERENYYLLLGLSVDPPEKDPKVIAAALKQKQAEWSRFRNHPTKSMVAKRYIGMIPDIRKVLSDPKLRQKEIQDAKKRLHASEVDRFAAIDRHIEMLMRKGTITKKEITALAKIDEVSEDVIRDRIKKNETILKIDGEVRKLVESGKVTDKAIAALAKKLSVGPDKLKERVQKTEKEKFAEVDDYLGQCSQKGFITEAAIEKLARIYNVKESKILSRVECPIKAEAPVKAKRPKPLDATLVRLIDENLKIVGKSSLYDFLDMPTNAPLDILQEVSRDKEMEIRRTTRKDAVATASGALAGHCIVVFRSKKSRDAYDLTRNLTRLSELNTDIAVAGIDGKIRPEYFERLVSKAIRVGMDFEEAVDYIREQCGKEGLTIEERIPLWTVKRGKIVIRDKWSIELNPKTPSFWILVAAGLLILGIIGFGVKTTLGVIREGRIQSAYEDVQVTLRQPVPLERKEQALKSFIDNYGNTEYAGDARNDLMQIRREMEKADYADTIKKAEGFEKAEQFEKARQAYDWYLKKHPKGAHAQEIQERIDRIPDLIDDRDFQRLKNLDTKDFARRIQAYNNYFQKHPKGRHIEDVRKMILNMVDQYFSELKRDLAVCENANDWRKCIEIADRFVEKFNGTQQAETVKGWKIKYRKRLQHEKDLEVMWEAAKSRIDKVDFEGARQIYANYLEANPEAPSYMRRRIAATVEDIEARKERYMAEEEEWDRLKVFAEDRMNPLAERISRLETYLAQNIDGRHTNEAQAILGELLDEKASEDARARSEREQREWAEIVAYSKNSQVGFADRIGRVERFLNANPSDAYRQAARKLLDQLQQQKAAYDERVRAEQARRARIQNERNRVSNLAARTGRYVANGDGTITDKRTGLMWSATDSYIDLGRCIDFSTAQEYVGNLKTGGHTNWRLPTVDEIAGIYKTQPYFPSSEAKWYWSSDLIWHGWNKMGVIVTTEQETAWKKLQIELGKCGAVRAVRNR